MAMVIEMVTEMVMAVWNVLLELAPSLLLGAALAGVMHVLLPSDFAARQLRGAGGVLKAVAFGVPLPLCSCGVLPAGLGLKRDGASDGAAVGFLISTPQTGVDSMLVSASFLGWPFALFKVLSASVTGLVGGWLADRVAAQGPADENAQAQRPQAARSWRSMIDQALEILRSIWGWLVIGVLISAAIEVWVPAEVWAHVATWGGLGAAFAALIISLPLYVCATASVPIAAALVAGGMPAGAALVFLMAGPATNAATVGAIYRSFGVRILSVYLGTLILGSLAFGLAFDFLLGGVAVAEHEHHAGGSWWALASTYFLLGLVAWFALDDARRWLRGRTTGVALNGENPLKLMVDGMTCNGCVAHLERTLRQEDGIDSAEVSLDPGSVVVQGKVREVRVRELISEAGYRVA
jgi:uncharacterized membrane protein YraQ (UPF0718 family)/copper chaperone CopZ